MKKRIAQLFAAAFFAALLGSALPARAGAITSFNLTDHTSGLGTTSVSPGGTFTLDIRVRSDTGFNGLSLFLNASTPNAGQFVAISRATASWPQNGSTDSLTAPIVPTVSSANGAIPKVGNSIDFGFVSTNLAADLAASPNPGYAIESLSFSAASNLAPGVYTLSTTGSSELNTSPASGSNEFTVPVQTFSITVVPEPATLGFAPAGISALLLRRRRISG